NSRALGQRHVARRFAEVTTRRRFCAVEPAAEINPVQVKLHDLLFADRVFDAARQKNFDQLALDSALLERKGVARELLWHGTRALSHMTRGQVLQGRAHDAEKI